MWDKFERFCLIVGAVILISVCIIFVISTTSDKYMYTLFLLEIRLLIIVLAFDIAGIIYGALKE